MNMMYFSINCSEIAKGIVYEAIRDTFFYPLHTLRKKICRELFWSW